jgi:hypothetical protein
MRRLLHTLAAILLTLALLHELGLTLCFVLAAMLAVKKKLEAA